jgi:hypothetical protein
MKEAITGQVLVYWFTVNGTAGFDRSRGMGVRAYGVKRRARGQRRGALGGSAARPRACGPVGPRWRAPGRA